MRGGGAFVIFAWNSPMVCGIVRRVWHLKILGLGVSFEFEIRTLGRGFISS